MGKLVHGKGINDIGKIKGNRLYVLAYSCWKEMLRRCYSEEFLKRHNTYNICEVIEEWHTFSNFVQFFNSEYKEGYQLDKDIIVKGNKIYSKDTCCFVPSEINSIIETSKKIRGKYPIGVYYDKSKNKFRAFCSVNDKSKSLGNFDTAIEAFICYKEFKENYIKQIATKYYREGLISEIVYNSLICWEITISD